MHYEFDTNFYIRIYLTRKVPNQQKLNAAKEIISNSKLLSALHLTLYFDHEFFFILDITKLMQVTHRWTLFPILFS